MNDEILTISMKLARPEDERVDSGQGEPERDPDGREDAVVTRPARRHGPLTSFHSKTAERAQSVSAVVGTTPRARSAAYAQETFTTSGLPTR